MKTEELKLYYREDVENVECEDVKLEEVEEMIELGKAMIKFAVDNGGVGLAAPQVGYNKKLIVWEKKNGEFEIGFNPEVYITGKYINTAEGCLSYPGEMYYLNKQRSKYINGIYHVPNKERTEFVRIARKMRQDEAIRFQHEKQHIDGITIAMIGEKIEEEQ